MPRCAAGRIDSRAKALGQNDECDDRQADESANHQRQDKKDLFFLVP
jgi:hypothetical protein